MKQTITRQDIDRWVKQAYKTACEHGFHDKEHSDEHYLMLIITEIAEAVNADRKGNYANKDDVEGLYVRLKSNSIDDVSFKHMFKIKIKDKVSDELADVCIRIFDYAGLKNLELIYGFHDYDIGRTFTEFGFKMSSCAIFAQTDNDDFLYCLSDILMMIGKYCANHGIDLKKHIELKMKYNELREFKNGKNY